MAPFFNNHFWSLSRSNEKSELSLSFVLSFEVHVSTVLMLFNGSGVELQSSFHDFCKGTGVRVALDFQKSASQRLRNVDMEPIPRFWAFWTATPTPCGGHSYGVIGFDHVWLLSLLFLWERDTGWLLLSNATGHLTSN